MSNLTVSASPHFHTPRTTRSIMLDVIIALIPACIASGILFGLRAFAVIGVCITAAVLAEYFFNMVCKKEQTVSDLSAVVTGLLLGLNVPYTLPLWQGALGSVMAIVVVKCLFGGIGQNFANPAITARIFLLISFGNSMTAVTTTRFQKDIAVSSATPLGILGGQEGTLPSYLDLFLGNHGGALGETCVLALLAGGIYLLCRKVISWHTPAAFLGTVIIFSLLFKQDVLAQLLSGGLMLGAFFMATDYVTTPNTKWGRLIFGIGCGFITMLIRVFGSYPEGVSFSILLMNILTPYIDRWTATRPFGGAKA